MGKNTGRAYRARIFFARSYVQHQTGQVPHGATHYSRTGVRQQNVVFFKKDDAVVYRWSKQLSRWQRDINGQVDLANNWVYKPISSYGTNSDGNSHIGTKLQNIIVALQHDGSQYFVEIPKDAINAALHEIAKRSKGCRLSLIPAPDTFNFAAIQQEMAARSNAPVVETPPDGATHYMILFVGGKKSRTYFKLDSYQRLYHWYVHRNQWLASYLVMPDAIDQNPHIFIKL